MVVEGVELQAVRGLKGNSALGMVWRRRRRGGVWSRESLACSDAMS